MDLSKAFDCINHEILYSKLKYYGLQHSALGLMKSYLSNRRQYVHFRGRDSNHGNVTIGVPQGSILGPLLFLVYINDITHASEKLHPLLYADDSTFSQTIHNITDYHIFNFLGLTVNCNLEWSGHVDKIKIKLSRNIGIIKRLKACLPKKILVMLYHSLIHSHLNYMILIWGHESNQLLTLQKKALRIINSKHYYCHSEPLFKENRILKVTDVHKLHQLKFCHNVVNSKLPLYFRTNMIFETHDDYHRYETRHRDQLRLPKPTTERARKCVRYSLPRLINSTPDQIVSMMYSNTCQQMVRYCKEHILQSYSGNMNCGVSNCYSCSR